MTPPSPNSDCPGRRKLITRAVVLLWLVLAAAGAAWIYVHSQRKVDKLAMLFQVMPAQPITRDLLDGWIVHESFVYAYTRRSPATLNQLRTDFLEGNWTEGDGRAAMINNSRPSYPGFFDPGGMFGADLYMTSGQTGAELWAFDNGAVFLRKRIAKNDGRARGPAVSTPGR